MADQEINYPEEYDILPETTSISVNIADTLNVLRDAILNIEEVLGLNVNIGIFTSAVEEATVSDRITRLERGIAERNLVYQEINVSDALSVFLNEDNKPFVRIGKGLVNDLAPVQILGPLTILSPQSSQIETYIQTPVCIDVTTFDSEASARSKIKGKANVDQPLLIIEDTNSSEYLKNHPETLALQIKGNVKVEGKLIAEYSIDHDRLLNTETIPTEQTRGNIKHVVQGMYHSHRKGRYDNNKGQWIVDSSVNTKDFGILNHNDLEGIGTLPTDQNDFVPQQGVAYHVSGGDLHDHSGNTGGGQINHNDLKNVNPKISNHVTSGDSHDHVEGRGAQLRHSTLSEIGTGGTGALHVTFGDEHNHEVDIEGIPVSGGSQISHKWLSDIGTALITDLHVTGGDNHKHSEGDGGQISHIDLGDVGVYTHVEIDSQIDALQAEKHRHLNKSTLDNINQNLSTNSDPTFNNITMTGFLEVGNTRFKLIKYTGVFGNPTTAISTSFPGEKIISIIGRYYNSSSAKYIGIGQDICTWDNHLSASIITIENGSGLENFNYVIYVTYEE